MRQKWLKSPQCTPLSPHLRSVRNGAQTQVDVLCTYRQVPNSLRLPAKPIFYDLSWQTRGITRLGPYSLDKDSLYINGECLLSPPPCPPACYKGFQLPVLSGDIRIQIQAPNQKPTYTPEDCSFIIPSLRVLNLRHEPSFSLPV